LIKMLLPFFFGCCVLAAIFLFSSISWHKGCSWCVCHMARSMCRDFHGFLNGHLLPALCWLIVLL
jgi:hypothetical protein